MAIVKNPLSSEAAAGPVGSVLHRSIAGRGIVSSMPTKAWVPSLKRDGVRDRLLALTPIWAQLDYLSRIRWRTFAALHPSSDRWNRPFFISGFAWYMKLNLVISYHAGTPLTDPPPWNVPTAVTGLEIISLHPDIDIRWDHPAGDHVSTNIVQLWWHYRPSLGRAPDRPSAIIIRSAPTWQDTQHFLSLPDGNYTVWARPTDTLSGLQGPESRSDLIHISP